MALLNMFKNRKPGSTLGRICDSLFNSERRRGERKNRRLLIDQLEERTLLSVYTPDLESNLVNIAITENQGTVTASSLAMDKDGDFVVVWSRVDPVLDGDGNPVIDPATGEAMTDENIYARYMTKEVQQVALPAGVLNYVPGSYAKMSIRFGGNEVQKLSFGATTASGNNSAELISGTFKLSYIDGDGLKHTTAPISYNEADFNSEDPLTDPALLIQDALRALGGDLEDVVVKGIDAQNFTISFGDASGGENVNELFVEDADWATGFLPGAFVDTVSEPFTIENITISPTNPYQTAMSIEDAFEQYYKTQFVATDQGAASLSAIVPTVEVVPVKTLDDPGGLRTFNIEFTGDAAYQNVPTLVIEAGEVLDANGVALNTDDIFAVTLKETGEEFRVNPEEPDSPFTQLPDKFDQTNPSVAMNAEGNFVIVWESEVPESQNYGSETDIFARMYQAVGVVDPADNPELNDGIMTVDMDLDGYTDTAIQGVRLVEAYQPYSTILEDDDPLRLEGDLYTFRVNVNTSAAQGNPSVGMDAAGNFTIAWSDSGQVVSFFNTVNMRQFSYDGTPQSAVESAVNYDNTEVHDDSYVAMSDDGYALIIWSSGSTVYTAMYDPDGYIYQGQSALAAAAGGSEYSAYFDSNNNYAINWTVAADNDVVIASAGVYFAEYTLDGGTLRSTTRANSGSTNPYSQTTWFHDQYGGQIVMDADGDLTVVYSGYGPDTNGYYFTDAVASAYLQDVFARDENADLIALWPDLATDFAMPLDGLHSGDIDGEIEEVLIVAQKTYLFNDEQLGRLRTIMETVADLSRGEASGVMYSQFDADPTYPNPQHVLISDSVVNSQRDGNNARIHLALDAYTSDGTFLIAVQSLLPNGGFDYVEVEPAYVPYGDDQIIDPMGTVDAIQDALDSSAFLYGNCAVRIITPAEMDLRDGTYWELDWDPATQYVYEITFQGTLHDCPVSVQAVSVDLVKQVGDDEVPADPPIVQTYVQGNPGTYQQDASIGMTPEGDYVIAYTEYNLDSLGNLVASNIYYRTYDETVDTAGPTVTSVETPDGVSISESPIVYQTDNLAYIVLTMSEAMYDNLTSTGDAVTNPENYRLSIGGEEVEGAISQIYYGLSEASNLANKAAADPDNWGDFSALSTLPSISYEIVVVVDYNGLVDGTEPLHTGNYMLELLSPSSATLNDPLGESGLRDAYRNRLNRTGFNPEGSNTEIEFTLVVENDLTNKEGLEVRVNETTDGVQTTSVSANEEFVGSTQCVAIDNDGDFVVIWVSEDQDGDGAGVYMRRYNNEGNPLSDETLVNTTTVGDQLECSVAMDADGDFVVVWSSEAPDGDGSWDIYGQRFDSMGRKLGTEFRVNSSTANHQVAPTIAMDSSGNFVVAWASQGQDFSYFNDIRAQVYNSEGQRLGNEIRVNSQNIPGALTNPSSNEVHPSVSVSEMGTFVVSWTAAETQKNGVTTNAIVMARVFDFNGNALTIPEYEGHEEGNVEFRVNVGSDEFIADYEALENHRLEAGAFYARNAQVTMNRYGEFIVVWEAWQDNDWIENPERINSYGIYYRQYTADGVPKLDVDTQANQVVTALATPPEPYYSMLQSSLYYDDQYSPSIAVDADGDFFITWSGNGSSTSDPLNPQELATAYDHDQSGVFVRSYHATSPGDDENPAVTPQTRVNTTDVGDQGTSSIAVTPSGTYVVVWSGKGGGDSQGVYFTYQTADTDTAGPMVTDFLLPDGTPISSSGQITQQLSAIIVTFDEDMYDNFAHTGDAVTNPENYALLIDGVEVTGGISQVFFGLDKAYELNGQYGLNAQLTNKYQAVLIVDANGDASGVPALTNGQYQIVVKDNLRDVATNPLYSTGLIPDGGAISSVIYVNVPTGQETLVADGVFQYPADGEGQYTYASTADSVAADSDGDFVVAWTDTTPGQEGVWIQMYMQETVLETDGSRTTTAVELGDAILISDQLNASDISVARDADGDFIVTWSAYSDETGWDVYAQQFDATGTALGDMFRVNSYTDSVQRYSAVATDVDGDFVITWQSLQQDGSGYGIYAKRFSHTGDVVNGSDEMQQITFANGFTGTFRIRWDDDDNSATADKVTSIISYGGNAFAMTEDVENALKAIGADVEVTASSVDVLTIRFVGESGGGDVTSLWVSSADIVKTGGDSSAEIVVETIGNGQSGEFIVNDTTEGNQMYPDIAMDADGDFVITWTSTGQDGDAAVDSNIYARQFVGNYAYWTDEGGTSENTVNTNAQTKVSTTDDPADHVLDGDSGTAGVVQVETYEGWGSGVLLLGTNFILTAAHVVWSDTFNAPMSADMVDVHFDLPDGRLTVSASQIIVHPDYTGDATDGNDLALIKLSYAPEGVTGYELYEGDVIGQVYTIVGYGMIGTGETGATDDNLNNYKLFGQNRFESTGDLLDYPDTLLVSDFDSGDAANDVFGILYGINDLGLGDDEALSASGDSGGPLFIGNRIAAIVSFGYSDGGAYDVTYGVDSSFGEFDLDTNVQPYADWINLITQSNTSEFLVNSNDILGYDEDGNITAYYENQSGSQMRSSVAMDDDGDYVIVWTSYGHDGVGNGYGAGVDGLNGVFARRYYSDGEEASNVFQVNQTGEGDQQNARVSMDADGDFIVVWESYQDGTPASSFGIFARYYAKTEDVQYETGLYDGLQLLITGTNELLGNDGEMGGEFEVNTTKNGSQRFPGVAMDDTGDVVIVWSGNGEVAGQEDPQGIFFQRYAQSEDDAGPIVTEVMNVDDSTTTTTFSQVLEDTDIESEVTQFIVYLGEEVSTSSGTNGADSILNPSNWQLTMGGTVLSGAITNIQYGLNMAYNLGLTDAPSNKYEAVVTFDSDSSLSGNQPLGQGTYVLTIKDSVKDIFGNKFDGNYDGTPSLNFTLPFTVMGGASSGDPDEPGPVSPPGDPTGDDPVVNSITEGDQESPAVAADAEGNSIVVWVSHDIHEEDDPDSDDPEDVITTVEANIKAQLYDKYGQPVGIEFTVNTFTDGEQIDPDVAMDDYGNFVVVWSGQGDGDQAGVYGRVYDKFGRAVSEDFRINQTLYSFQDEPSVAMDADGDFVVSWTSYGQDGDLDGIYARRFSLQGEAKGGEILVNSTTAYRQDKSDVAMDADGDFVVVWQSDQQDGNSWGIYGQRFSASGAKLGAEFAVNTYTLDDQIDPAVAMDADGDFVVAWSSMGQDGSGYGVYARRYGPAGVAKTAAEFRVNQTVMNWQVTPDVAMSDDGTFIVTWSSFGHDNLLVEEPTYDYGIFARMYNADGTNYKTSAGTVLGEFRINGTTEGNQLEPAVTFAGDERIVEAWTGPNAEDDTEGGIDLPPITTDVFMRILTLNGAAASNDQGPTISKNIVAEAGAQQRDGTLTTSEALVLTWNLLDADGVQSTSLMIDGNPVTKMYGPYTSASGVNYAAPLGTLSAGTHSYKIIASDASGNTSQLAGSFLVTGTSTPVNDGPTLSGIVVGEAAASDKDGEMETTDKLVITFKATSDSAITAKTLTVDGTAYTVFRSGSSDYYYCPIGNQSAGAHNYTISMTDGNGTASETKSFAVVAPSTPPQSDGPTLSGIVVAEAAASDKDGLMETTDKLVITFKATSDSAITAKTLTVDGAAYKVYRSGSSDYYYCPIGNQSAGAHNYAISLTDGDGTTSENKSFTVVAPSTPPVSDGPTISSIVVAEAAASDKDGLMETTDKLVVTFKATSDATITAKTLTVDGTAYTVFRSGSSDYYYCPIGNQSAGAHNYAISLTDANGTKTKSGSFSVSDSSLVSPLSLPIGGGDDDEDDLDWVDGDDGNSADAVDLIMASY